MTRAALLLLTALELRAAAGDPQYIGPEPCALCHKEIATKQQRTAMATTWQSLSTPLLPQPFDATAADNPAYRVRRSGASLTYSVSDSPNLQSNLPVEILVGGGRHGFGFLVPVSEVGGIPLSRRVLIQARYAWSPTQQKLLLAPGCSSAKPQSLESALGLVLSPTFEARCVTCHGRPNAFGTGKQGGVRCESCHGPASNHLPAIAHGNPRQGIVNPKLLSPEDSITVCAQCHVGLTRFSDPSADDLLVANQVRAIKNSECFIQSGKAFSCTACHDPHNDTAVAARTLQTCLGCHSMRAAKHAAICPVNAEAGCSGCHMPPVDMGVLHLVDHSIRVHPEQNVHAQRRGPELKSQLQPLSAYLRMIACNTAEAAVQARQRILNGESFYKVAQESSLDSSSSIGGYLGRKTVANDHLALDYGETSDVIPKDGRWLIFQRLPRDFRWQAEQLQAQAESLSGPAAVTKAQEALKIYPPFLRALRFLGITYAQNGSPKDGIRVLSVAAKLYPEDASLQFALASIDESLGENAAAIAAYRKAISLEQDFTAAYVSLGQLQIETGDAKAAIETFRQGLVIDPMSPELNSNLGHALLQTGDTLGATRAADLARKLTMR